MLAEKFLKRKIQDGSHDSVVDATTALDLAKLKIKHGPAWGTGEGRALTPLVDLLADHDRRSCLIDRHEALSRHVSGACAAVPVCSDHQAAEAAAQAVSSGKYAFVWTQLTEVSAFYKQRADRAAQAAAPQPAADGGDTAAAGVAAQPAGVRKDGAARGGGGSDEGKGAESEPSTKRRRTLQSAQPGDASSAAAASDDGSSSESDGGSSSSSSSSGSDAEEEGEEGGAKRGSAERKQKATNKQAARVAASDGKRAAAPPGEAAVSALDEEDEDVVEEVEDAATTAPSANGVQATAKRTLAAGRNGVASGNAAVAAAPSFDPDALPKLLAQLDAHVGRIWDAAPPNTLVMIVTGQGDTAEAERRVQMRIRRQRGLDGLPRWTQADDDEHDAFMEKQVQGLAFLAVKQ